jgi:peptide/nickel transport system substrate-binding protein
MTGYDPPAHDTTGPGWWEASAVKSFTHIKLTRWDFSDPTGMDQSKTPTPDLAESWETSDDGLVVTFHLREGVKWANIPPVNGREVVADDVVFSYNYFTRPEAEWRSLLGPIVSIEAPDDYTVVFTFSAPYGAFLSYTGHSAFPIEAPEVMEEYGNFDSADSVIGAGPWMLTEYEFEVQEVFERNPDYYRGANGITGEFLPYIDKIVVLLNVFEDPAKIALYRAGDLNVGAAYYYWGYWTGSAEISEALADRPDLIEDTRIFSEAVGPMHALVPKIDRPPLDNQTLRQAISTVLNRSDRLWYAADIGMVEARELVSTHEWFVPIEELGEGAKFYPVDADGNPTLDFELGRELVAQYREEVGLGPDDPIVIPIWFHRLEAIFEDVAVVFKADLAEIGIDLQLEFMEFGEFQDTIWDEGDFEGIAIGWTACCEVDPGEWFTAYMLPGSTGNDGGIDDPEVTELVLAQEVETDPEKRAEIIRELQRILAVRQYQWMVPNWTTWETYPDYLKDVGPHKLAEQGNTFLEAWFTEDAPAREE